MIRLKSKQEIEILREGGKILGGIMQQIKSLVKPGVSVFYLNEEAERLAILNKARSAFKGYQLPGVPPFPSGLCVSINDEVVHGFGSRNRTLNAGDIVSLDMGIEYKGLFTDHAITMGVGKISKESKKLLTVTHDSLMEGIEVIQPGRYLHEVSKTIQKFVEQRGYSLVRDLCGHGVGYEVHEDPAVPNFYAPSLYPKIKMEPGLVIAIEPMVNVGIWEVYTDDDHWTIKTRDGELSAHFEHTVAVTEEGYEILTLT